MKRLAKFFLVKLPLALISISLVWVLALKVLPVSVTPLMIRRSIEFRGDKDFRSRHEWVPLDRISPAMVKSVIASEDNRFAEHNGFDVQELRKMYSEHERNGKKIRGCSTISQQTAKNVFTFGRSTLLRKGVEAYYTFLIEKIWGKRRIMEVYLNVAETGRGLYGVEAAARFYWGKSAEDLTLNESALLTACLPDPVHRSPLRVTGYLGKRRTQIISLTRKLAYPDWVE